MKALALAGAWLGLAWLGACSSPDNPLDRVAVEGRYAVAESGAAVFGFPGIRLRINSLGPVTLDVEVVGAAGDAPNALDVRRDGGAWQRVDLAPGRQSLTLDPPGSGPIDIVRRSESWQGELHLHGVTGPLRPRPGLPTRRIMFVGDSITAGAGTDVQGSDVKPLDNARMSFGRVLGERLDAQVHMVAFGGRGIIRDWRGYPTGREGVLNAPALYGLAAPGQDQPWEPSRFVPDAVVIGLGTNDFNPGVPDSRYFVDSYAEFIARLRADFPGVPVLVLNSPMTGGDAGEAMMRLLDRVAARSGAGVERLDTQVYPGHPATLGHPTAAEHEAIADEIEPVLRRMLGLDDGS